MLFLCYCVLFCFCSVVFLAFVFLYKPALFAKNATKQAQWQVVGFVVVPVKLGMVRHVCQKSFVPVGRRD